MFQVPKQKLVAAVAIAAILFGILTVFAGSRVLLGADPGYVVYLPLLRFNTLMGLVYIVVGVLAWRHLKLGMYAAAAVCVLNAAALGTIVYLYGPGASIASTSLGAMSFRCLVWLAFFLLLVVASRSRRNNAQI